MKILGCIFSVLLFFSAEVKAQGNVYKRPRDWKPSSVFVSADVVGLTRLFDAGNIQSEFQAKIDFDQFFLVTEFGLANSEISESNFDYSSNGNFYRIGLEADFLPYSKNRSNLTLGLVYSSARMSDKISYAYDEGMWSPSRNTYSNDNITSSWLETTFGLSVNVFKGFYLGYNMRFKVAKIISGTSELFPYEIPGFGPAQRDSNFGFNYYITYRFGLRNKPIPVKPKKREVLDSATPDSSGAKPN